MQSNEYHNRTSLERSTMSTRHRQSLLQHAHGFSHVVALEAHGPGRESITRPFLTSFHCSTDYLQDQPGLSWTLRMRKTLRIGVDRSIQQMHIPEN